MPQQDKSLSGFDPKTQYAIQKLRARYPHADDLLSALLADVEKNEKDGDMADKEHMKLIKGVEQKLIDVISKNDLKEDEQTKYGIVRYPDTAISYIKNDGSGWEHIYDKSYGFKGPVDKEDLKYAKKIAKEKIPARMMMPHNTSATQGERMGGSSTMYESVKENDLRSLVHNEVSIDQYKSKLGKDEKVIVLGIKVKDKDPAQDLSQFIESKLNEDVLDVEVSPGPNEDGDYTVFVEITRHNNAYDIIESILRDVTKVDKDFLNVTFKAYENKESQPFTKDNFEHAVITDARDYQLQHNPEAKEIAERMKFLTKY
jgi:hypothetical protein